MPDKIYIGNFKGLVLNRKPFNIDNETFMTLFNAYARRSQVKRKRGTSPLGRLEVQIDLSAGGQPWQDTLVLVADEANLISGLVPPLEVNSSIAPGTIHFSVGGNAYTEPNPPDGTLLKNGLADPNSSINYATGAIFIQGGAGGAVTSTTPGVAAFGYFPDLPVLGLEDFVSNSDNEQFPLLIAFDTKYAYEINQSGTPNFFNVSYYKGTNIPFTWSGANYQQFWSTNYQHAFWASNNKPGFHFVNGTSVAAAASTTVTFNFKSNTVNFPNLIIGDKLNFFEWAATSTVNALVGTVSNIAGAAAGNYVVTFSTAVIADGTGIAQLLTNSITGQDGIKWYDGDPTSNTGIPSATGLGWVNFSPPLSQGIFSIDDEVAAIYYLVGALHITPFKGRLLFSSPWIQTSVPGATPIQLTDVVLWSWDGTPYYNSLVPTGNNFNEIFDPLGRTFWNDQTGFGGNLPAGISKPIKTLSPNEDVLLIGFGGTGKKTRLVFTGNDLQPFLFYLINSEMPSASTFSAITMDYGMIDIGQYGICETTQQSAKRTDLDIPDEVFKIQALNNGQDRVNAVRNFYKEWIYFSYPTGDGKPTTGSYIYPSNTFMLNYRDGTWSILRENYTHHGTFRRQTGYTWNTLPFSTWERWREPWNAGSTTSLFPDVIAGNPQGYVIQKDDEGTGEAPSGDIQAIADDGLGSTVITSVNHCVNIADHICDTIVDYLYFTGALGILTSTITGITNATLAVISTVNTFAAGQNATISDVLGMTELNGNTYEILSASAGSITINVDSTNFATYVSGGNVALAFNGQIAKVIKVIDANRFVVDLPFPTGSEYLGLGTYTRLSQPLIQTKQFPFYWDQGRKTRIGVQKYLLDSTTGSQITLNMYLSQDPNTVWNAAPINPQPNVTNSALMYSQILYTCPEQTNLFAAPANITFQKTNLNMTTAQTQDQIWHRVSTSLIGDTVQIGFTLSDAQMRNITYATDELVLHAMQLDVHPAGLLS